MAPRVPLAAFPAIERLTMHIERVPAHDLRPGDEIIVDGLLDDYVGAIVSIEEYSVHWPGPPSKFGTSEANGRCLVLRLPHLNTYRARHDTVRRVVADQEGASSKPSTTPGTAVPLVSQPPTKGTLMEPTVGRIVHFHPNEHDSLHKNNSADFHAAIITQVWTPTTVNMIVFPAYGLPEIRSSVTYGNSANSYWAWPPREG